MTISFFTFLFFPFLLIFIYIHTYDCFCFCNIYNKNTTAVYILRSTYIYRMKLDALAAQCLHPLPTLDVFVQRYWLQLPGPGGACPAVLPCNGDAPIPIFNSLHRNHSILASALCAVRVGSSGLQNVSAAAANLGQTLPSKTDASVLSPHLHSSPPSTSARSTGSVMFASGSVS